MLTLPELQILLGSVHLNNILIYIQQDATLHSLFYLETALHVSGGTITHHQERKQLYLQLLLIFMEPCIVVWLVAITNEMQLSKGILLFHSTLTVQHVSSVMSLIIRNLNCTCSYWFTYACGDRPWCRLIGNWVPTQTAPRAVSTSVCKPEAASTVEVPDDERHNARNMLNC